MAKRRTADKAPIPVAPIVPQPQGPVVINADNLDAIVGNNIQMLRAIAAVGASQNYDVNGFAGFYNLIHNRILPLHARAWVDAIFQAYKEGKPGVVIEAFRGSWKTTTLTVTFAAWWLGHNPSKSVLLVQVGDDIAIDNTAAIASMIQNHAAWKVIFPNVVPDEEKGWGAGGYEIKRSDMPYSQWRELCAARKDPSLLGAGYKSREIIGKHPGLLIIDDIHDENNTASVRELDTVKRTLTGTILPTATKDTFQINVGTPWKENDALAYLKSTGEYVQVSTPVIDKDGKLAFPEQFAAKEIERARRVSGSMEYARMYLLDLSASKNKTFKYMVYPNGNIKHNWVYGGGADYAGTMDEYKNLTGDNDYFALCYLAKLPGGGAVCVDGVLTRCTQGEAELHMKTAQEIHPIWQGSVVEGDGKGEDFIQVIRRNPGLKIIPMKTGGKGKSARLERQLGPWLENGAIRISDADTPFLNELRYELDSYPANSHDDALDSLYWAVRGMPDVCVMQDASEEIPEARIKKRMDNPFKAFAHI